MQNSDPSTCPTCHLPIAADAPGGLCPACTLVGAAAVPPTSTGSHHSPAPSVAEIAPHFPELEILELLGAGGMGAVYKVRQPQLDRTVALKLLSRQLAQDPAFVERFNREARVLARLSHPNIVAIFDFGTAGPYCYLLMEYVDGVNLRQAMRTGGFTPGEALALVQDVCAALQFAHEEGILHRDIKPENILIDAKGRVKIADFGIAKLVGGGAASDVTLTLQGSILGSPHYMAPEQFETPGDVDQRADIYSLGVVLYEMLTGGLPIGRFALPSEKSAMDARIDDIVLRTLATEREARFQSAQEVSTRVDALNQSPAPVPPASTPAPVESGMARFSLLSAILTFVSILFGVIVAYLLSSIGEIQEIIRKIGAGWALFNLVASLGTAFAGFMLGASALSEIRRSGGAKGGLGSAIFATTAWPVFLVSLLATVPLRIPSLGEGPYLGPVAVIFVALLPALAAAWMLVRALYRWAKGAERKDGTRFHPRLALPLLAVMLLAAVGPLLLAQVASRFFPGGEGRDPLADSGSAAMREETRLAQQGWDFTALDVPWHLGKAEVFMDILLKPGLTLRMRLLAKRPDGSSFAIDLGELGLPHYATDSHRHRTNLEVGTYIRSDSAKGSLQALAAVFPGGNGRLLSREDLSGWAFNDSLPDELVFDAPDRKEYTLATLAGDGVNERDGELTLEIMVTHPTPAEDLLESP